MEGATGHPKLSQQPQHGWTALCASCPEVTSLKSNCFGSESSQLHGFGGCHGGEGPCGHGEVRRPTAKGSAGFGEPPAMRDALLAAGTWGVG